jgi:hypothetical protein
LPRVTSVTTGDEDLTRHVLNARLRKVGRDEGGFGRFTLEKAGPGRLIDGCVAAVLAVEAWAQMPAETGGEFAFMIPRRKKKTLQIPAEPKQDDGPVWFFAGSEGGDLRDVSKPVAYDENGRPLYGVRGPIIHLKWPWQ